MQPLTSFFSGMELITLEIQDCLILLKNKSPTAGAVVTETETETGAGTGASIFNANAGASTGSSGSSSSSGSSAAASASAQLLHLDLALEQHLQSVLACVQGVRTSSRFMEMTVNRCIDYTKASTGVALMPQLETVNLIEAISVPVKVMTELQSKVRLRA